MQNNGVQQFTPVMNGMNPNNYTSIPTAPPMQNTINQPLRETPTELLNDNWSSGICDCCGKGCDGKESNCCTCCLAGCWGGLAMAFLLERLGLVSNSCGPTLLFTAADMISVRSLLQFSALSLRRSLISKLGRKETQCDSCCIVTFCFPCALAQMERDAMHYDYKFDTPKLDKSDHNSYMNVCMACAGGISSDSFPHKIHQAGQQTTRFQMPFTQNRMLRYYIRTQ